MCLNHVISSQQLRCWSVPTYFHTVVLLSQSLEFKVSLGSLQSSPQFLCF